MLHYKQLTKAQKHSITNGCGGKGGFLNPPDFLFKASCNHHDFYYWRGGTSDDRQKADDTFLYFMLEDAQNSKNFILKLRNYAIAITYYGAVRIFGSKFFHYGKMRTKKDL